jgi:hypothetical protein
VRYNLNKKDIIFMGYKYDWQSYLLCEEHTTNL